MCDRVKDGDKLHKVLESWRMPEVSDTANETGLIKELVFQINDSFMIFVFRDLRRHLK